MPLINTTNAYSVLERMLAQQQNLSKVLGLEAEHSAQGWGQVSNWGQQYLGITRHQTQIAIKLVYKKRCISPTE